MKKLLSIAMFAAMPLFGMAQSTDGYYTKYYADKSFVEKAQSWLDAREWAGSFTKAKPHAMVNAADFYEQYQKNKAQWDALFAWLQNTDLLTVPGGKHIIEGANIKVSVEDSENEALEKRRSESHHHVIDFMIVVKGVERFGVIDHNTSVAQGAWRPDVIHYDYDKSKAKFYDSTPGEFFIFFPNDWHIAKVANDTKDQTIRVIVAKVNYVD